MLMGVICHLLLQNGNTALHIASLAGKIDCARVLIEKGANVNLQSQVGLTNLTHLVSTLVTS